MVIDDAFNAFFQSIASEINEQTDRQFHQLASLNELRVLGASACKISSLRIQAISGMQHADGKLSFILINQHRDFDFGR